MERWVCPLTVVAANGNVTQLYPAWAQAGSNPASATVDQQVRQPCEGKLFSLQCLTDGVNTYTLELYDISGIEIGVDVSSSTVITDAQLDAAIAAGKAKLIFNQLIAGSGLTPIAPVGPAGFMKGLAARAWNAGVTGTCSINLGIEGGFRYIGGSF